MPSLPGDSRLRVLHLVWVAALALLASDAGAQPITVTGTVVDQESGVPLSAASVDLIGATGNTLGTSTTGLDGTFRVTAPASGRIALLVSAFGYVSRRIDDLDIGAGTVSLGAIRISAISFDLNPVIVTASRRRERAIDAPAAVHVVDADDIELRPATSTVDHLLSVPAVDVVTNGVSRHSLAVRGFNSSFNSDLLVLTDYRWAAVPSLRLNAFNLLSTSNDDIERIEVVAGPGSALYGPNTANGVVHVITKSPLDSQGTSVSVIGGERSLFQGSFRHAGLGGENLGYKISATYFRASEWEHTDPVETANRRDAIDAGADPDTLLIGARDFAASRFSLDGRVDARLGSSLLVLTGGASHLVNSIEQLTTQTAQAQGWTYSYAQARLSRGRLFAQAYANLSDAGDSYSLRSGARFVDRSRVYAAQVQHGTTIDRLDLNYGADFTATRPETGGTIHGRHEDSDNVNEVGAYAQAGLSLSDRFDLVVAGRVDNHDALDETVFSPRGALIFAPREGHSLRATYNRAFLMPTTVELFADLVSSPTLGGLPYAIRVEGQLDGWTFRRDCGGGLCMRSPFTPAGLGGPGEPLPLDATLLWGAAVQVAATLNPTAGALLRLMAPPTAATVGTTMRVLNPRTGGFDLVTAVADVEPLRPSISNTFEVGYKGLIADRVLLGVDVYHSRVEDFISSAYVVTPNVFLDPTTVGAHIASEVARLGLPVDAATIAALATGVASVPLATVTPEAAAASAKPADVVLTIRNFGDVSYWGADLSATVIASDRVSLTGSYSYVSNNLFEDLDRFADVPLNAPRHKLALSARFDDPRRALSGEVRGRAVGSFPFSAGVFVGDVEAYQLLDVRLSYGLPFAPGTSVTLAAVNLFDHRHAELPGSPEIGRLVTIMLRAGL